MSGVNGLPNGWTIAALETVLPIEYGKGLPAKQRAADGEYPVFGSNGLVGYHSASITHRPTLIVGRKGAAGAVHFSPTGCWPIDTAYFTVGHEGCDLKYFLHLLRFLRLDAFDKSTAIPSLSRDDYNAQQVPVAPLNEQRRIVEKIEELFSDLDAGVAALERTKANLKRYRAAVLKAAVEGIVVGSMPIDEISTALSADGGPGSLLTPAGYLQLYLAYAKAVSDGDAERIGLILDRVGRKAISHSVGAPDSPFEEDVQSVLERFGYTVDCQVGECGFRIDLAVMARNPEHGYLLGIECDGAAFHSDRSARLRDVWREQILRQRGWNLHRIWSTRWWYRRAEEIEALQAVLETAQARLDQRETRVQSAAWEMTLAEWRVLKAELNERGDIEGLRSIGGLGTDSAHLYQVEQALRNSKPVQPRVLADYPNLRRLNEPVSTAEDGE